MDNSIRALTVRHVETNLLWDIACSGMSGPYFRRHWDCRQLYHSSFHLAPLLKPSRLASTSVLFCITIAYCLVQYWTQRNSVSGVYKKKRNGEEASSEFWSLDKEWVASMG